MNLQQIASDAVSAINPAVTVSFKSSTGYTTNSDGSRVATYAAAASVSGQIQPLTANELQQINGLNVQGTKRAIYLNGDAEGLVRSSAKGGDLITFPDNSVWLIVLVLEHWPDWSKVAVVLQDGS